MPSVMPLGVRAMVRLLRVRVAVCLTILRLVMNFPMRGLVVRLSMFWLGVCLAVALPRSNGFVGASAATAVRVRSPDTIRVRRAVSAFGLVTMDGDWEGGARNPNGHKNKCGFH